MSSPLTTPTASYLFPNQLNMTITSPTRNHDEYDSSPLCLFLSRDGIKETEIVGSVEEFCWRGMMEGRRVRGINEEVVGVLDKLERKSHLIPMFANPPLSTLLPFLPSSSNPYFPSYSAMENAPLLPAFQLNDINRKQLIEALVKLSKREVKAGEGFEALVMEVCLEYVGKRWRDVGDGEGDELVEEIAKNLTEVEFEIQIQGNPTPVRSSILPTIQKIRFQLGLVSSSQLVTRLQSLANQLDEPFNPLRTSSFCADQLIDAWLRTRLRVGGDPQSLVDEMISMRDRLRNESQREAMSTILTQYGLLGRGRARTDSVLGQSGVVHPPSQSPLSPTGRGKRNSNPDSRSKLLPRKTMGVVPKWWSHRRNNSSSSKLHVGIYANDRRPSLPVISTQSPHNTSTSALSHLPWGRTTTSLNSNTTYTRSRLSLTANMPTTPERGNDTGNTNPLTPSSSVPDLLSSMLTFSDPEDMRFILLDHLLGMKYNLSSDSTQDWYLGNGRESANEIIDGLALKLIRRKDVIGLRGIFSDIRSTFNIPESTRSTTTSPRRRIHSEYTETLVECFPAVPPREVLSPLPQSITSEDRDASFDLERYISDITLDPLTHTRHNSLTPSQTYSLQLLEPDETETDTPVRNPRRSSAGADSMLTMTSTATGHRSVFSIMGALNLNANLRRDRMSMMSSFTIREATRENVGDERRGVEVCLDSVGKGLRRVASMGGLEVGVVGDGTEEEVEGYESSVEGMYKEEMKPYNHNKQRFSFDRGNDNTSGLRSYRRKSRSETDLSTWKTSILNTGKGTPTGINAPSGPLRFELGMGMGLGKSLRRRERIEPRLNGLSAWDLRLEGSLPKTPRVAPFLHLEGLDGEDEEYDGVTPRAEVRGFSLDGEWAEKDGRSGRTKGKNDVFGRGAPRADGKNALEVIMGLFVIEGEGLRGKEELSVMELRRVLREVVDVGFREVGDLEKVTWLIKMARDVLNEPLFESVFVTTLSNLKTLDETSVISNNGHSPLPPTPIEETYQPRPSLDSVYSSEEGCGSVSTHSSFSTGMASRPLLRVGGVGRGGGGGGGGDRTMSCFSTGTFGKGSMEFERGRK